MNTFEELKGRLIETWYWRAGGMEFGPSYSISKCIMIECMYLDFESSKVFSKFGHRIDWTR
jgi:hypothetical protein